MISSGSSLLIRLWPSWPGLAPPGLACSRRSLRSVAGGLEEVREVFSGRCSRSTSSISSSRLRRSRSLRPIPRENQRDLLPARGEARPYAAGVAPVRTGRSNHVGNYVHSFVDFTAPERKIDRI